MDTISIPNIPHLPNSLHWLNQPQSWDLSTAGQLVITAGTANHCLGGRQRVSDDCNAFAMNDSAYLCIIILEKAYAFHVSEHGITWNLIRYLTLEGNRKIQMGFASQSSTGRGCTASFCDLRFEAHLITELRSGE